MERHDVLSSKNQELESEVQRNREDLLVRNKELRFQVYSLETLMGLTHQLNASLELEPLLNTLILSVMGQLRVNSACLFLTDDRESPTRLDVSTFKGLKGDQVRGIALAYDSDLVRALRPADGEDQRSIRLASIERDPGIAADVGRLFSAGLTVVCPAIVKGRLTAIVAVGEKVSGQEFQSADLEMLRALAESAGIAIENARLFRDLQEAYVSPSGSWSRGSRRRTLHARPHRTRGGLFGRDRARDGAAGGGGQAISSAPFCTTSEGSRRTRFSTSRAHRGRGRWLARAQRGRWCVGFLENDHMIRHHETGGRQGLSRRPDRRRDPLHARY